MVSGVSICISGSSSDILELKENYVSIHIHNISDVSGETSDVISGIELYMILVYMMIIEMGSLRSEHFGSRLKYNKIFWYRENI